MAKQLFVNNFEFALVAPVVASPTTGSPTNELGYGVIQISVAATTLLPTLTGGDWMVATIFKRSGGNESAFEVVRVDGINEVAYASGTETRLRVSRAQEGTIAQAYLTGDFVSVRMTKGTADGFLQSADNLASLASAATARTNLGLGNVDNTSDANKPISTAVSSALALKAPLDAPALTGVPTAPTAAAGTNTTQIATTAHVFAERTNTATLTNKTISGGSNTITNIGNGSLTNSSVTVGTTAISLGGSSTTLAGLTSVTSTGFTGALTGNASTATTATNATNVAVTDDTATNATVYPVWSAASTGNNAGKVSSTKLTFNPSTGMLTSTGFTGPLTGNASTATSATSATNATNVAVTDDTATNATMYPLWSTAVSGNNAAKASSSKLSFNPSTGTLTATKFSGDGSLLINLPGGGGGVTIGTTTIASGGTSLTLAGLTSVTSTSFTGALTGNASTATSATSATNTTNVAVTDDTTTNATMYPLWATASTGNLPAKVTSSKLTYNPSTGTLSTTTFSGALSGNATSATNATNVAVTDDVATNATMYPVWVAASSGNQAEKVSSTKLSFNPSTGTLTATNFSGTLLGSVTTATNLAAGSAGAVPFQTGAGATSFSNVGSSGQPLISNGAGSPAFGTLSISGGGTGATSAAAALTALGGAPLASPSFTGGMSQGWSGAGATTYDLSTSNYFITTLSGATTLAVSNVPAGNKYCSFIVKFGMGAGTATWWSGLIWPGGTAPTMSGSGYDVMGFYTPNGGTTWYGFMLGKGFAS